MRALLAERAEKRKLNIETVCGEGKLDASGASLHLHGRRLPYISVCQAFWLISSGKEMSSEEYKADLHTGI